MLKPNKKYFRNCPGEGCTNIIGYKYIGDVRSANIKNTVCNDCRFHDINIRDEKIISLLKDSELTQKEIAIKIGVSKYVIRHVKKKYNIERGVKLSKDGKIIRSENFKKNVLDKNLNIYGGGTKESYIKAFKSRYGYEYSEYLEKEPEFKKYSKLVRNKTNESLRKYKHLFSNLDNLGRCGDAGKYQVDHIYSVKYGFINKISPNLIGHPSNLQVIKWEDNLKKSINCDISVNELINNCSKFLTDNHKIMIDFNKLTT